MSNDPSGQQSHGATAEYRFEDMVAEITDRLQNGEKVDAQEYAARHPEWAERLRDLLPALEVMAQFGNSVAGASGPPFGGFSGNQGLDRAELLRGTLGDFRIIREIGHGGMGVV